MLSELDLLLIVIGSPLVATLLCAPFVTQVSKHQVGTPYGRYILIGTMGGMAIALVVGLIVDYLYYLQSGTRPEISGAGILVAGSLLTGPIVSPMVAAAISWYIKRHRN